MELKFYSPSSVSPITFHGIRLLRSSLVMGIAVLMALGLGACSGSKALSKKGAELEAAGLHDNAAMYYYNSLLRNSNNVDARIGLARTGQLVVEDKSRAFTQARSMENLKEAVYAYRDLEAYREKLSRVGIRTEVPAYLEDDYRDIQSRYLEELYEQGNRFLSKRNFEEAHRVFGEMERLEPGYRDVRELRNISANEPIYHAATLEFDAGRYRAAYEQFDRVFHADPNYKEVAVLREECLDLGKFPIALAPFENHTKHRDIDRKLHAFVLTKLSALDDPFVRVVEREDIDRILREQRLSLSGLTEGSVAQQAGNLLDAKAIITGSVLEYAARSGSWKKTTKRGYERKTFKKVNEETGVTTVHSKYEPTSYNEYSNEASVTLSFQYKAISAETGEVLFSGIFERTMVDRAEYAVFSGEITELYPAGDKGPLTDNRSRRALLSLLRADRTIKTTDQLANEAFYQAASQLGGELENHLATL